MDEQEMVKWLTETLWRGNVSASFGDALAGITSFAEAGLLTDDKGFILTFADGAEFQVTVVKSAYEGGD